MGRKTPQEKKRLSYAKDRRNDYGENDKSSRNKRYPHRTNRHCDRQILVAEPGRLYLKRPKSWRKCADIPLGEYLRMRIERRGRD
ncbi:hypothetical protein [Herbidospora daliensis]|uniref:hypothetical protein n=1 Tax=Herbidospora daliensis TaxID=295585 RepID=UPI000780A473|nr:hypothetical protein [Herbidospora daliensis]